jgi:hypothetical protein
VVSAFERRIDAAVERRLQQVLQAAIDAAALSPWLDTRHAARYLGISENALRLRVRADLVRAHRESAGRLRFHRDDLDRSMTPEPPKRARR